MCINYSTTRNGLPPASMKFINLCDMLTLCDNLPDLEIVQRDMELADMEYGELWQWYGVRLAQLHHNRTRIIAKQLLTSKAA